MCAIFIWRFIQTRHWKTKLYGTAYDATKPTLQFVIARLLTAFSLSTYSVVFLFGMDVIELASTIVILSAMAGGSATVLAAHKGLSLSYSFILLIPISILCLFSPEQYKNIFGMLGLVFVGVMYSAAKRAAHFTHESILIKNQHTDLLETMELKNQEISEANTNLETKVKKRTEKIFELSNIDPLTKLFNRNAYSENLKLMIDSCMLRDSTLAVLFIDLDGFKSINDTYGHAIGDQVLIKTAERIASQASAQQSLCRWGGDEFLVTLNDSTVEQARESAKQLINVLSEPTQVEHNQLTIGCTVGIAMCPQHGTNQDQLITLADTAMYVQKQTSKSDVCVFTEKMREDLHREITLKEGLSRALTNDEFYVVFQPVINCKSKKVGFCEALLRWELDGQLVAPDEFVPVAEQHGLIYSIGAWVLHKSCQLATEWTFDDTVDLSVNVSVAQLMHGDLVEVVKSALSSSGLPASNLHIEMTESIFAHDIEFVLQQLNALQALNIKISVDDFGTGFSSLALLQSLSADVVKIDRTFIESIDTGGKAIIQATQYMASELGYSVVAEGVETKLQADTLSDMGIESLQGYYFARPMKSDQLSTWHDKFKKENEGS